MLQTIDFQNERDKKSKRTQIMNILEKLNTLEVEPICVNHHKKLQIKQISAILQKAGPVYVECLLKRLKNRFEN